MISKKIDLESLPVKGGFRLRGSNMTRLEIFSDAAFAFAMTMLVISVGNIPANFQELIAALKDIPAFAASFASIMIFWMGHRSWSQRFGLEDSVSVFLSLLLIFVVLVYVYPLKIVFSTFFAWVSGGWLPSNFKISEISDITGIFAIYGFGLSLLAGCLAFLNLRALKLSELLYLNKIEIVKTKATISYLVVLVLTGLASGLFAWFMPKQIGVYAGFFYFTLAFTMSLVPYFYTKKLKNISS